tara:strand:+ start:519 stop:689 length:171 start_codon:yes stop_codon:yes gene_type:complete
MGCGCGSLKKRTVKNKVTKTSSVKSNKKPVNSYKKDIKRNSRMVKIKAINKTLTKK